MEVRKAVKIAVIGATGYVGAPISREALARGHDVTAISRSGALPDHIRAQARSVDIFDSDVLARALQGHAAAIHAFNPGRGRTDSAVFDTFVRGHEAIIGAAQGAGVSRLLCVGGAGSLKTRDGIPLMDSPDWPREFDAYKDGVRGTRQLYYLLQKTEGIDWVFLSPSSMLIPGPRTGNYRVGTDCLLYEEAGKSHISLADYACAMIDELESPAHHCQRFTVGY
jgi:uncharacterized protein